MESTRQNLSSAEVIKQKKIFQQFLQTQKPTINADPIYFASQVKKPIDIEIIAWISSIFAFGNVKAFLPVLEKCISFMGDDPCKYLVTRQYQNDRRWKSIYYRWYKAQDILVLLESISYVLRKHKTLGKHAQNIHEKAQGSFDKFIELYALDWRGILLKEEQTRGRTFMMPDPLKKSTMKRLLMFLRWMAGTTKPDFGLWSFIDEKDLLIPLDTHIHQFALQFGWTGDKTPTLKTVRQVTEALRQLHPKDPMKFDFVLTHFGISRACKHKLDDLLCPKCPLASICCLP